MGSEVHAVRKTDDKSVSGNRERVGVSGGQGLASGPRSEFAD